MKFNFKKTFLAGIIPLTALLLSAGYASVEDNGIIRLNSLSMKDNPELKAIREDVRKSIYTIMSGRPVDELPELKIYSYLVRRGDSFWNISSKTSLDMDTILTINALSSPGDIKNKKIIYLPNMRGVVLDGAKREHIEKVMSDNRIKQDYVAKINKSADLSKKYIFIPGGKISSLERSLFLGTAFLNPVRYGRRTSGFGTRVNPFNKKHREFHSGIDIACPVKTEVYASRSGEVTFSGFSGGYGLLIRIKHEHGYESFYGHLIKSKVKRGDRVSANQLIGLSGNTGRTTGPHLHFEIRKNRRAVNPGIFLRR